MLSDRKRLVIAIVAIITLTVWLMAMAPGRQKMSLAVLDVGEGLCVVMRSPAGRVMVFDCGTCSRRDNESIGESTVLPYLRKLGTSKIDVAVLSHPHQDHISGYARLLKNLPPKLVMDCGAPHPSPLYKEFLAVVKKSHARYRVAKRGQTFEMDGVHVQVLSPSTDASYSNLNDQSVVLRLVYGGTVFLLTGDAGAESEEAMLASNMPLRAQVLQIGHHGSAKSCSPQFLAAVRPQVAVISCGRHNIYAHPSRDTLGRLQNVGARIYRTDRDGAACFESDGKRVTVLALARANN